MELQDLQTDQCVSLADATGLRCRNKPHPSKGGPWCWNHGPGFEVARSALQELEEAGSSRSSSPLPTVEPPDTGPESSRSSSPTQREAERADFSDPPDPYPSGSRGIEGIPEHGGPEEEGGARADDSGREVDPSLFQGLRRERTRAREEEGPELQEEEEEEELEELGGFDIRPELSPGGPVRAGGSLLDRNPGPFSRSDGEKLQRLIFNRIFRKTGKDPLTPEEVDFGAEPFAASANRIFADADPSNPFVALSLWSVAVLGTRYGGDVGRKVGQRFGLVTGDGPSSPSRSSRPGPELVEEEEEGPEPDAWSPEPPPEEDPGDQWTAGLEIVR